MIPCWPAPTASRRRDRRLDGTDHHASTRTSCHTALASTTHVGGKADRRAEGCCVPDRRCTVPGNQSFRWIAKATLTGAAHRQTGKAKPTRRRQPSRCLGLSRSRRASRCSAQWTGELAELRAWCRVTERGRQRTRVRARTGPAGPTDPDPSKGERALPARARPRPAPARLRSARATRWAARPCRDGRR